MWIDVQLVAMGYLVGPGGSPRHIPQLDQIARDTLDAGVRVRWGNPPWRRRACSYIWRREIVLAEGLFRCDGWHIRAAWSHELGHMVTCSRSDEKAGVFQKRYGVLLPAWAA